MGTKEGFKQINFQFPDKTFERFVQECNARNETKAEFVARLIVAYFLIKELGLEKQFFKYF